MGVGAKPHYFYFFALLMHASAASATSCPVTAYSSDRAMFSAGIRAGRSHSGDCVLHDVNIGVN